MGFHHRARKTQLRMREIIRDVLFGNLVDYSLATVYHRRKQSHSDVSVGLHDILVSTLAVRLMAPTLLHMGLLVFLPSLFPLDTFP